MTSRPLDPALTAPYSWEQMDKIHRVVADKISFSGFRPDVIVGILRCGQVPAIHLSYLLGVRRVTSISVTSTVNDRPLAARSPASISLQVPDGYVHGMRVLLVDAVMESGTTAELCVAELKRLGAAEVMLAMMVDWYNSEYKIASGVRPTIDFVGDRADRWPDFPWES